MSRASASATLRFLRAAQDLDAADRELLDRFALGRDEGAFAALLERHGPMVLGVCRRLLGAHDAEDVFQATFLVLARRACSGFRPRLLAGWLYGVARRTSLKARTRLARLRATERQATRQESAPGPDAGAADVGPILDEEVARLPDKYRQAVVLCYLEGQSCEDAARALGCPRGTLFSRLSWARQRLRSRLTRRGVTLPAGALAAVPSALAGTTAKAAVLVASGNTTAGLVSAEAAALTEKVVKAMLLDRLTKIMVVLVLAATLVAGAGWALLGQAGGDEPPRGKAETPATAPKEAAVAAGPREVVEAYNLNEALADEKFTAKRVRLQGGVVYIKRFRPEGERDPRYAMTLGDSAGSGFEAIVSDPPVQLVFPHDARKQLAAVSPTQRVTVEGVCEGKIEHERGKHVVRFRDCTLVKVEPFPQN